MSQVEQLITDNLDVWTSAIKKRGSQGRGSSKKIELYGIKKLRELILDLAVRGLLVPQDPNDEPASVLLEKIAAEKEQLVKDNKIKKPKKIAQVSDEEKPFELPENWLWCRLGEIGITQTGGTPKKTDQDHYGSYIPFVKPGDINDGIITSYENDGLSELGAKALGRIAPSDSVLMVCIGTIGKCARVDRDVSFNQQINSISPYLELGGFIAKTLQAPFFQSSAWHFSSSTTLAILNKGKWEQIPIPLAPEAEQPRIVAKVDELMALCDQLEQQTESSLNAHQTLVETLLKALLDAAQSRDDASAIEQAWQRISDHFDVLFTTEHSIDQLKQTILQLAVMGKLVPQDPNDEPASVLLEKIAAEKERLVKEGKIKKQKPLPPIREDEKPFELPVGWGLTYCQDICHKITDGEHATPKRSDSGHYLLSARNVTNEGILLHDVDFVPTNEFERIRKRCDPNIGDILISCSGSVGRVALVDRDNSYSMVRSAAMIRPDSKALHKEFIALLLRSPFLQIQMKNKSRQSAQANLFLGAISSLVLLIPPLAEQRRIVFKVDELFKLCEGIKDRINESQTTQLHLADAMAEQAIN